MQHVVRFLICFTANLLQNQPVKEFFENRLRVAGVTADLAAYRLVYDSRHLQADCQEPGSAPEPYAGQSSMGYFYLYLYSNDYESINQSRL